MMARAFGPGSGVLMSGAFMRVDRSCQLPVFSKSAAELLPLPTRRRPGVLQHDSAAVERGAAAIRFREVAAAARFTAGVDELFDLGNRHWRLFVLAAAQRQH